MSMAIGRVRIVALSAVLMCLLLGACGTTSASPGTDDLAAAKANTASRCVPDEYPTGSGSVSQHVAFERWYAEYGKSAGAPLKGWRVEHRDGFPDIFVNRPWQLILSGSTGMKSWQVAAVTCSSTA